MTEYIPLNVRAGEDTGPYGICKISCFAVGAAHLGRPPAAYLQARRRASISSFFFSSTPR